MSRNSMLGVLFALIVAHIVLAATYASVTPYRQAGALLGYGHAMATKVQDIGAPDERQHVNYVMHLLEGKGFPVFSPKDPNLYETYQSHQPPAYYVLASIWCRITGASDLTQRSDGLRLRSLNVVIGAGTVAGVFFLAFWGFRHPEVALAAAGFVAVLPMNTALSGAVSNDPMLICLCTWILALMAKSLRDGWVWPAMVWIGVLAGLAMLTKSTAIAILPIMILAPFLPQGEDKRILREKRDMVEQADWHGPDRRTKSRVPKRNPKMMMGLAVLLTVVMAGPWWARNTTLYGDPLAISAFNQAFQGSPQKADIINVIEHQNSDGSQAAEVAYWEDWVGWWGARSFFGVFGYMDIWMNERGTFSTGPSPSGNAPNTMYRVLIGIAAVCFVGWVWAIATDEWRETRPIQIMNTLFFILIALSFLSFNLHYFQAQARYLYPALGPIACGFGIGAWQILGKSQRLALPLLVLIFLGVNVYALALLPTAFADRIQAGQLMH